jgi:putative acetyltransferase
VSTNVTIRPAEPLDDAAILSVVEEAFADETRDASEELDIVRGTWAVRSPAQRIEFVAERADDARVVGHVLAAMGDLDGQAVAGVAPLGVAPAHQRAGVGTALMHALSDEAARRGWPVLLLLGDPAYYGRFGFTPAAALGIHYAPAGRDSPHFLMRPVGHTSAALPRGEYRYCWEL